MRIIEKNKYAPIEEKQLIKAYYSFYEELEGITFLRSFIRPNYTADENKHNLLDRLDENLANAIMAVQKINNNDSICLLQVISEDGLLAVSRFSIEDDELRVHELYPLVSHLSRAIFDLVLSSYEEKAKSLSLKSICLEIPWFDNVYSRKAHEFQFISEDLRHFDPNCQRTFLMFKNLELEKDRMEGYGRHLTCQ